MTKNEQLFAVAVVATAGGIVISRVVATQRDRAVPMVTSRRRSAATAQPRHAAASGPWVEMAMGAAARIAGLAIDRVEANLRGPSGPIVADYSADEAI